MKGKNFTHDVGSSTDKEIEYAEFIEINDDDLPDFLKKGN